ncbi:hydroxypyruvate isomerase family protein [Deinococcus oregonensis]|uniref:Hydroxypyruvate isomerase family protein n=1 Tax=Deinococcus oregonensis TaxID=1805970 RepID=A0ABV6B064_9DEIO
MKLSICIEMIFAEEPDFARRIQCSVDAGLPQVEMWGWRNKDLDAIERVLAETGGQMVSFVSEPGGRLVDPATHNDFLRGLRESLPVAQRLGTRNLIVLSGDAQNGVSREQQHEAICQALKAAAPLAEDAGVTLNLEPLNSRIDHVGYYLDSTEEGLDIIREVNSPHVRLLYDLYHSVVMDERPEDVLQGQMNLVGHLHVADHPGRHEPGSGQVPLETHLRWINAQGYAGYVGLEYVPTRNSLDTLHATSALVQRAMTSLRTGL